MPEPMHGTGEEHAATIRAKTEDAADGEPNDSDTEPSEDAPVSEEEAPVKEKALVAHKDGLRCMQFLDEGTLGDMLRSGMGEEYVRHCREEGPVAPSTPDHIQTVMKEAVYSMLHKNINPEIVKEVLKQLLTPYVAR